MNSLKTISHIFRGQTSRTMAMLVFLTTCLSMGPIKPAQAFANGGFFYSKHFEEGGILKDFLAIVPEMEGRLSFEEVRHMPDSLFYTAADQPFTFGETLNYWIKLRIINDTDERRTDMIASAFAYDTIEVYSIKEGFVNFETMTGRNLPPASKRVPSRRSLVNYELEPGQSIEYYIRGSIREVRFQPHVLSFFVFEDFYSAYKNMFFRSLNWIFLASVMVLFALLALALYFTFREKIFITYSLLLLFLTLYFLDYQFTIDYLVFSPFVFDRHRSNSILVAGIIFCTYLFISRFLALPNRMPLFSKFYLILAVVTSLFSAVRTFLFAIDISLAGMVSNVLVFIFAVVSYLGIILLSFRGQKEAKVLLISMLFMFVGAIVLTLSLMDVIPRTDFTNNSFQWGVVAFSGTLFYGLFEQVTNIQNDRIRIRVEKEKTDELLFNILPYEVATELKEKGHCEARDYARVNVLFTDFKNFTYTSTQMSAKELVHEINSCFVHFDHIIEKYRIEKIKTIGDAYMAASGLETKTETKISDIVLAGIEMQEYLIQREKELALRNLLAFKMRVGIHTGPVVAGIVGVKKFQYDIWGDTVNTASRIESYGEVGKVNISDTTYQFIKDHPEFAFEKRGEIEVKGKGKLQMWFVSRADNQPKT